MNSQQYIYMGKQKMNKTQDAVPSRDFEPKRLYRWTMEIPGIPAFILKNVRIPSLRLDGDKFVPKFTYDNFISIELFSATGTGIEYEFKNLLDVDKTMLLKFLSSSGVVVGLVEIKGRIENELPELFLNYENPDILTWKLKIYPYAINFIF